MSDGEINGTPLETYINAAVRGAAECLQWQASDTTDNGNGYPIADGGDEYTDAVEEIPELVETVTAFVTDNAALLAAGRVSAGQCGHDLILTANGPGTGFWDRGLGDIGRKLTKACRGYSFDAEFALFGEHADGEETLADEVMWLMVMNTVIVNHTQATGKNGAAED